MTTSELDYLMQREAQERASAARAAAGRARAAHEALADAYAERIAALSSDWPKPLRAANA